VTNGATVSTGWTITWTFAGDQSVSAVWNGLDTSSGATHSVRNLSYNGSLAPNQSTTFGFNATGNATGAIPTLTCTRS
jgi:cellulase/cellobiase CelA1